MKPFSSIVTLRGAGALAAFVVLIWVGGTALAQSPNSQNSARLIAQELHSAKQAAYGTFKAGDLAGGVSQVVAMARLRPNGVSEDLEVGRQLADITWLLRNEGNTTRAGQVAQLALNRLANPEGRMPAKDATAALMAIGALHEYARGDMEQARQAYQRALTLDPQNAQAKQRLAHLNAIDEIAQSKATANAMLIQGRKNKGNP